MELQDKGLAEYISFWNELLNIQQERRRVLVIEHEQRAGG
jgi:hypothetical protein